MHLVQYFARTLAVNWRYTSSRPYDNTCVTFPRCATCGSGEATRASYKSTTRTQRPSLWGIWCTTTPLGPLEEQTRRRRFWRALTMNWIADTSHGSGRLIILTGFSGEACGLGTQRGPSRAVYSCATVFRLTFARSLYMKHKTNRTFSWPCKPLDSCVVSGFYSVVDEETSC